MILSGSDFRSPIGPFNSHVPILRKPMTLTWLQAHTALLWWLGVLSGVTFIGTLILVPLLVVRIPADYFMRHRRRRRPHPHRPLYTLSAMLKNLLGIIFILAGVAMLILPGQGILTILLGIMLMNFPGKHTLERRIVQQPAVLRAINWMRTKANHPELKLPNQVR